MEEGWYWYFTSPEDADHWCGDVRHEPGEAPCVYYVMTREFEGREIADICIADISLRTTEVHGTFVGPLQPPPDPRD